MLDFIQEYDVAILDFLNGLGVVRTDPFWLFITKKHVWIPFFVVLFFFAFKKFSKKQILIILIAGVIMLGFVLGLTEIVKNVIVRVRPCNNSVLDGLFREVIHPKSYSFYSGHAASSVAVTAYFISLLHKQFKLIYVLILWSVMFMFSRLYFAAHYPSDILVGILVGFLIARIFVFIVKRRLL